MEPLHHPLHSSFPKSKGKSNSPIPVALMIGKDRGNLFLEKYVVVWSRGMVVPGTPDKTKDGRNQDPREAWEQTPDESKQLTTIFFSSFRVPR